MMQEITNTLHNRQQQAENVSQNNHIVLKSRAFSFENNHKVYSENHSFYHRLLKRQNVTQIVFRT